MATTKKLPTEQVKRPTVKSLQQEMENLTKQLIYANGKTLEVTKENSELKEEIKTLRERSIIAQIVYKLFKPFS